MDAKIVERPAPADPVRADSSAETPVLAVTNVSKRYEIYERPEDRLKQAIMPRLELLLPRRFRRSSAYFREFWALRDVSLTLGRGEAMGILGRNGAGKSTLLQIIAGTSTPTAGTTFTRGRVAALLELGSGFSPEFTGRENVHMNASLLGLTADEIAAKFDEIAAFADIGDFIEQPVKTYSSGMMLRLAFAVQTAVNPEILIVDEALAVGDARFQKKCFARLEQLQKSGTTILLVTHDSGAIVQFCTRAIILENGRIFALGEPQRMAREYHKLLFDAPPATRPKVTADEQPGVLVPSGATVDSSERRTIAGTQDAAVPEFRYGTGEAKILAVGLRDDTATETRVAEAHTTCEAYFRAAFKTCIPVPVAYGFIISNARGVEVYGTKSGLFSTTLQKVPANTTCECRLRFNVRLVPGRYFLSAAIAYDDGRTTGQFLDYRFDALEFQVVGPIRTFTTSLIDLDGQLSHTMITDDASS
jgi:lipopolysaccharide transport system ATP-binding protein